jgi:uncharacterized membrane protein YeiB
LQYVPVKFKIYGLLSEYISHMLFALDYIHATRRITGVFHICGNFYINLSLVITELELELGADWQSFELHIPVQFSCPIYMSGTVRDLQWGLAV